MVLTNLIAFKSDFRITWNLTTSDVSVAGNDVLSKHFDNGE